MTEPVTPTLFTPHDIRLSDSIAKAIAEELAAAPENGLAATVSYLEVDGVFRVAAAYRFGRDWVLGGFYENGKAKGHVVGAAVTVKF